MSTIPVDLKPMELIEATFSPRRTDDLIPGAEELVGQKLKLIVAWTVTTEKGGVHKVNKYAGEWACISRTKGAPIGWLPSGDLQEIEVV